MFSFFDAVSALVAGVAGGYLADLGQGDINAAHSYSFSFWAMAACAIANAVLCVQLRDPGSMSVRETLAILSSSRNLRSFIDIAMLDLVRDPVRRQGFLLSLESSESSLATNELRQRLQSPLPREKERLLNSLFFHPRPELCDAIIAEAEDPASFNREHALFALGAYPGANSERALRSALAAVDPLISAIAAKSLARIGCTDHLPAVRERVRNEQSPVCVVHLLVALGTADTTHDYLADAFARASGASSERFSQTVLVVLADVCEMTPPLAEFFHKENLDHDGGGFSDLLEECRERQPFLSAAETLQADFEAGRFAAIRSWCRDIARDLTCGSPQDVALRGALVADMPCDDPANALAAVYFTYQLYQSCTA
jgi:hypothetical protein